MLNPTGARPATRTRKRWCSVSPRVLAIQIREQFDAHTSREVIRNVTPARQGIVGERGDQKSRDRKAPLQAPDDRIGLELESGRNEVSRN